MPWKLEGWTSVFWGGSFHAYGLVGERRLGSGKPGRDPNPTLDALSGSKVPVIVILGFEDSYVNKRKKKDTWLEIKFV